jgi:hypothetical protein
LRLPRLPLQARTRTHARTHALPNALTCFLRSAYVACWACEPPPCRQEASYECERGAGSFFNEDTQACEWLRLRVPPFDCPLVRLRLRRAVCARVCVRACAFCALRRAKSASRLF